MGIPLTDEQSREADVAPDEVAIGSRVEVELIGESGVSEHLAFDIVPDDEADFASGFLGVGTPLARAVLGRRAGNVVPYRIGGMREVRILTVAASMHTPTEDIAASRQATIQKAISQSNLADAVRFALAVDVKWGDYDPEGIVSNWE